MSNQFEIREKFDEPWFFDLPPYAKLLKNYLDCACDSAGFLKWSQSIAEAKTGIPKAQLEAAFAFLLDAKDVDGPRVLFRAGWIYVADHIAIQDPNGLTVTNLAHGGILRRLFAMLDTFPECVKYIPQTHSVMRSEIELYLKEGTIKNKESAMKALLRELDQVKPEAIDVKQREMQMSLFDKDIPGPVREGLRILSTVPGYPFDYEKDLGLLMDIVTDFGMEAFLFTLKEKVILWNDEPPGKSQNARLQLRRWFSGNKGRAEEGGAGGAADGGDVIKDIFDFWNQHKIMVHRKLSYDRRMKIKEKLKDFRPEEIKQTIANYGEIISGPQYERKYTWTLEDFLDRGFDKFVDLEIAKKNHASRRPGAKPRAERHGKGF